MTNIRKMSYFLCVEVLQSEEGIFISQKKYQKFNMSNYNTFATIVDARVKLGKELPGSFVDPTLYKNLVGSLCNLTITRSDILLTVRL